jgi:hypothetical protein
MNPISRTEGCGCVYYVENGYVVKAKFCEKHKVVREILVEGLA